MPKLVREKVTQRMIDSLKPVEKEAWLMDSEVPGLGIRMRPKAAPVWGLRYKLPATGQGRKDSIGPVGQVSLAYARKIARQKMTEVDAHGDVIDPKIEKRLRETVGDLVARVVEDMTAKGNAATYVSDFRNQCRDHVEPFIGTMMVRDVTQTDVDRVLSKLRDRPHTHNRVRSNLSKLFNVARRDRIRADNPVFGAEKMSEEARERLLNDEEMVRLLKALDARPCMEADALRLLWLTGSRPKELLQSRWENFSLTSEPAVWTKPALTVKTRKLHRVDLSDLAKATLLRMQDEAKDADEGDYVFPSRKGRGKHLTELKDYWAKVEADAGLEDARVYDLRKAFASRILAMGADLKTAMSLTGHTNTGTFIRHYAKPMVGAHSAALAKVNWNPGT